MSARLALAVIASTCAASAASADQAALADLTGAYHCTEQQAAGLAYDAAAGAWKSATFPPTGGFTLHVEFAGTTKGFANRDVGSLTLLITDDGSDAEDYCTGGNDNFTVAIDDAAMPVACATFTQTYRFSFASHRYLRTDTVSSYLAGGTDNASDPEIAGGTCTKIAD